MIRHVARIAFMVVALTCLITRPVAASDMNCAQWMAYRTGDTSMKGLGLVLITYLQGYIDAVNEFSDVFKGNLISEVSPGKFAPTPPTRQMTLENTVAGLDRQCTGNPSQSAHVVAINEVHAEMARRATPIMDSMGTLLRNLNNAKGYK